jgi:hypothetical protein
MLQQNGTITFVPELMSLIESFLEEYESTEGALHNDLERGLVISYILGVMHCELSTIWDGLDQVGAFGEVHPRSVFETCANGTEATLRQRRARILAEIERHGWFATLNESS